MPDQWILVSRYGELTLNPTFRAPQYQAGGVDASAALRRDGRTNYQRSGDGLRTPGPLVLEGVVWRDDQDVDAIVAHLNDISDAVRDCVQVIRSTSAGAYVYGGLAGGPPPEVTPDGLGGWRVRLELWPERAEATLVPTTEPPLTSSTEWLHGLVNSRTIPNPGTRTGDLILLFLALGENVATKTPPDEDFVEVASIQTGGAGIGPGLYIWRKTATEDEPSSWTVTLSGFTQMVLAAAVYRGVDTSDPFVDTAQVVVPELDRDRVLPSIDGVLGGRVVAAYTAHAGGGASEIPDWGAWQHPMPPIIDAGSRERRSSDTHLGVSDRPNIVNGPTGQRVATYNTERRGVGWVATLRPAS